MLSKWLLIVLFMVQGQITLGTNQNPWTDTGQFQWALSKASGQNRQRIVCLKEQSQKVKKGLFSFLKSPETRWSEQLDNSDCLNHIGLDAPSFKVSNILKTVCHETVKLKNGSRAIYSTYEDRACLDLALRNNIVVQTTPVWISRNYGTEKRIESCMTQTTLQNFREFGTNTIYTNTNFQNCLWDKSITYHWSRVPTDVEDQETVNGCFVIKNAPWDNPLNGERLGIIRNIDLCKEILTVKKIFKLAANGLSSLYIETLPTLTQFPAIIEIIPPEQLDTPHYRFHQKDLAGNEDCNICAKSRPKSTFCKMGCSTEESELKMCDKCLKKHWKSFSEHTKEDAQTVRCPYCRAPLIQEKE